MRFELKPMCVRFFKKGNTRPGCGIASTGGDIMFRLRVSSCCRGKIGGALLMLCGLIIMMLIVPGWAVAGIICVAMIVIGFLLWRFC